MEQKELEVYLNDQALQQTDSDKLLGVLIDNDLNFKAHIRKVHAKVSQSLALLRRIKNYLPISAKIKFYNAFIMPHLEHCCTIWGDSTDIISLCKLQNRAARMILDKPFDFPSFDALHQL